MATEYYCLCSSKGYVKVPTEAEVLSIMNKVSAEQLDPYIDKVQHRAVGL